MMQDIVTLQQAKDHLRITTSAEDADVLRKIEEATTLCLDYVRNQCGDLDDRATRYAVIDAWDEDSAPVQVRAAILRMTGHLYGFRGDEDRMPVSESGALPSTVTMFLNRLRDPTMA